MINRNVLAIRSHLKQSNISSLLPSIHAIQTTNNHLPTIRSASSFVPGTLTIDQLDPLPKPPSPNWFTTHPALSDSFSNLDALIHRSRQILYRTGVLKRYAASPDFSGTGVRLKWLKWKMEQQETSLQDHSNLTNAQDRQLSNILWNSQAKWHPLQVMSILLQGNENRPLRMIEYTHATRKLNELKALKKYLMILKSLQLDLHPEINQLDTEIEQVLLKYSKPEATTQTSKDQQLTRDQFGRFYGLGRKKESTARAWMIEVKLPESLLDSQASSSSPSSVLEPTTTSEGKNDILSESSEATDQSTTSHEPLPLGKIIVNGRSIADYFHSPRQRATAIRPLDITNSVGHYNIHILAHGGGKMGQAAAISQAISNGLLKALQEASKSDSTAEERYAKKVLLKSQLALRDPRVVERKKTGKPGAKSSYRWVKR